LLHTQHTRIYGGGGMWIGQISLEFMFDPPAYGKELFVAPLPLNLMLLHLPGHSRRCGIPIS
jgi:hypothetical protein